MKVSYSWLKYYVDARVDPKKLAHILTMAGVNVASCESTGGDYIFDFEIMANRPDCLSVLGIAREVAALLGKKLKIPKELQKSPKPNLSRAKSRDAQSPKPIFEIEIKDPELCPRYTARIIKDVEVGPSPDWLKEKIISVGLRPINNIVDITNFVLIETGQPMHAFDLDKIKGRVLIRRAQTGEKIITIDNIPRVLNQDILVIADESDPIAAAGIMGGLETEVTDITKNILLESAFFDPVSIRRTSRALGVTSESSYRFERRINNDMVIKASERASALIEEIAGGKKGELFDIGRKTAYSKTIDFDLERSKRILGISVVKKSEIAKILKALAFSVKDKKSSLKVTPPSFREDVKSDIDLTEEIARIYGYEKIPLTIPHIIGNVRIKDSATLLQDRITQMLTKWGLNEIVTYGLISKKSIEDLNIPEDEIVSIKNPLSIDQEIMRTTLLPGMLKTISYNLNRKVKRLGFFEMGKIYKEKKNSYIEEPTLAIGLAGIKEESWKRQKQEFDFFDIKGIFEKLLDKFGIGVALFKKGNMAGFDKNISSIVEYGQERIACLGKVDEKVSGGFDIERPVFYGELYLKKLLHKVKLDKKFVPLCRYPSVIRDTSLVLDKDITSSEVINIIKEVGKKLVRDISLTDSYRGEQISEGKRGLLYRIEYRSDEKTLEDSEIDRLHSEIKNALAEKLGISFR